MKHVFCMIMAGGRGERFWPLSTLAVPKPFLPILGEKTMIQAAVERACRIVPPERVFVVIGKEHLSITRRQLPELKEENLLVEPEGRDTAPCIGYGALALLAVDPEAVMVALPADHYVGDPDGFTRSILHAIEVATAGDHLVTIGVRPTRPETGYGYIHAMERMPGFADFPCLRVKRYVEKPDADRAMAYLNEGHYYWNSGMFVWKAKVVMKGLARHMPDLYSGLLDLKRAVETHDPAGIKDLFGNLPKVSIDYGLMEKAENVLVIPSDFGWDDVGTWGALPRTSATDGEGNWKKGRVVSIDTQDSVMFGEGVIIGAIGLSGMIVVASKDAVLVCHGSRAQDVREIAKLVEAMKKERE